MSSQTVISLSNWLRFVGWAAIGLILLGCLAGLFVERGMELDFANYYDAGHKARVGQFDDLFDPFAQIEEAAPLSHMSFTSAPLTSLLYVPMSMFPPSVALIMFKLQSALFIGLGLAMLYQYLRRFVADRQAARDQFFTIFWGGALLFQPFWTVFVVGGQVTPLVFAALVLALVHQTRGASVLPAACWVLAVAIKPVLAPGLLFLLIVSTGRFRLSVFAITAALAALSISIFGIDLHFVLVERILEESRILNPAHFNSNMFAWIEPLVLSPGDYATSPTMPVGLKLLTSGVRLVTIGGLIWLWMRHLRTGLRSAARQHFAIILALVFPLILTPVAWAHYLALLFIPLMSVFAFAHYYPARAKAVAGLAIITALMQNLILWWGVQRLTGLDDKLEMVLAATAKSLPMLLCVVIMFVWVRNYRETGHDPAWDLVL